MAAARPSSSDDEGACSRGGAVRLYVCLCDATLRDCDAGGVCVDRVSRHCRTVPEKLVNNVTSHRHGFCAARGQVLSKLILR
jgi:hypothetical protein